MTAQSLSINLNGTQKNIPTGLIPIVDEPMHTLLGKLLGSSAPAALVALSEKVKDLTDLRAMMEDAIDHPSRDKMLGIVPIGALLVLLSATVLGFMFHVAATGVICLFLTLGFFVACHLANVMMGHGDKAGAEKSSLLDYPIISVLSSPFTLSHHLLNRASSLQTKADACEKEVQAHASDAIAYWKKNNAALSRKLQTAESSVEKSLTEMKSQPVRSLRGEKDLADYQDLLARTRAEIAKASQMAKI